MNVRKRPETDRNVPQQDHHCSSAGAESSVDEAPKPRLASSSLFFPLVPSQQLHSSPRGTLRSVGLRTTSTVAFHPRASARRVTASARSLRVNRGGSTLSNSLFFLVAKSKFQINCTPAPLSLPPHSAGFTADAPPPPLSRRRDGISLHVGIQQRRVAVGGGARRRQGYSPLHSSPLFGCCNALLHLTRERVPRFGAVS